VSGSGRTALAEKKALLAARAELDRARILLASREIKAVVMPRSTADRASSLKPAAAMLIGFLGPAFGSRRVAIGLRVIWLAITAFRIARRWK
jgi:hypothetical protein